MLFDEAVAYLLSLGHETLAIKLGLNNTERLLEAFNQPQNSFFKVQIAGTNGKGSTAAMLHAICRAAKINTGLYTSPHLVSITERIRINESEISQEDFAHLTNLVRERAQHLMATGALNAGSVPTFFEHVTVIALLAFARARVEIGILETGMGGRLDATTVAGAEVVAIAPIALDHQEYLGATLKEIAAEKAAIIRADVKTALVAPQEHIALQVILKRCEEVKIVPQLNDNAAEILGSVDRGRLRVSFRTQHDYYKDVLLGLRGRHQLTNASLAISLAEALRDEHGFSISREAIKEGLETAHHPGRLDLLPEERPALLLDGAHNAAGARALRGFFEEFINERVTLIFGAMRDKQLDEMAHLLFPLAHQLILTEIEHPRAASTKQLLSVVPAGFDASKIHLTAKSLEALDVARNVTAPDDLICATGSLYLIGEIIAHIRPA